MDGIYRYQRHIYDLTRRHYLFGRDTLIGDLAAAPGERILEIGCGTARNLIRMARHYPGTELCGIDASREMLQTARRAVNRCGSGNRITLVHGLAEQVPRLVPQNYRFDHLVFSYSLSMIGDWRSAIAAAASIAQPTAQIHLVDFADFGGLWPATANLLRLWLRLFHVKPRCELLPELQEIANSRQDCRLKFLPFRYAFVFKASIRAIADLT
jgi:S-adenosylmethionine-diacylgycerolhomoserine-N-methlytransferase